MQNEKDGERAEDRNGVTASVETNQLTPTGSAINTQKEKTALE